jgi:hypothetical protein
MRKLLLPGAATLGTVSWLGTAGAQTTAAPLPTNPSQGQVATRPAASPPASAFDNNNQAASVTTGGVANPTPGTVVIHINGRVTIADWGSWTSVDKGTAAGGNLGYKVSPISVSTFARLYTGVDGMATNGLRYGGSIEIRQNFPPGGVLGQTASPTFTFASSASTNASTFSSGETLFVRRAFGYLAGDSWGIVRLGQGDGPIGLYDGGVTTFQFLPSGNLSGSGNLQDNTMSATSVPFLPSTLAGAEYVSSKIVYLSPQLAGFDFGVSWSPNTLNGYSVCTAAGPSCVNMSSGPVPVDGAKPMNLTEMAIRYQGTIGDLAVLAYGAWVHSGHTDYSGPVVPVVHTVAATAGLTSGAYGQFDNINMGQVGVALTYAGFRIGGNWTGGAVNGQLATRPSGGSMANGWVAGLTYTTGPLTAGIVGEMFNTQGAAQLVGLTQRNEWAINPGLMYTVAPGLQVWGEYLYQARHQNGFNFVTGAAGSLAYNNVKAQGFLLGSTFFW